MVKGIPGGIKRRTYRKLRAEQQSDHHNVYVVLLDPAVGRIRKVRALNPKRAPKKPCVYVGMTGLLPEERLADHKAGIKYAWAVKRHGIRRVSPQQTSQSSNADTAYRRGSSLFRCLMERSA